MNFGEAFSYQFKDPDWAKKMLIPGIIALIGSIIIIGPIVLLGWGLEITRRVLRQDPTPLPELDFGQNLIDGLKAFVVGLVYALPAIIISIPLGILTGLMSEGGMDQEAVAPMVAILSLCCNGLIALYSLAIWFILPAAFANMVANDGNLGAAFRFSEVISLVRAAPGAYLLVLVGMLLSGIIAQLGVIACVVGLIFTLPYSMSINSHLYAQAYLEATGNRGFARVY